MIGTKPIAEDADPALLGVGERCMLERSLTEMTDGPYRSENADISNEKQW